MQKYPMTFSIRRQLIVIQENALTGIVDEGDAMWNQEEVPSIRIVHIIRVPL